MSFDFSKNLLFTTSFEKAKNRTELEYKNDQEIFKKADRGYNGDYILNKTDYNKLSEKTKQELSQYTKFHNEYISISKSL